jgi:uncharacterized alpha-E superfamily protein
MEAAATQFRVRESTKMLSRVADSLYWMSRYLERAENTVRQLDVAMSLMLDSGGASAETHWVRLVASLGNPEGLEWTGDPAANAESLVFDKLQSVSVASCIDSARENARQIREEISTEQWQRLNRLYHQMHSPHTENQFRSNINDVLSSLIDAIHLFKGVSDTTMIHGQGWHFIRLGRYLERSYAIATLLQVYQPLLSCSTATFPMPSATRSMGCARPFNPSSTPAGAAPPTSSPRALAVCTPC